MIDRSSSQTARFASAQNGVELVFPAAAGLVRGPLVWPSRPAGSLRPRGSRPCPVLVVRPGGVMPASAPCLAGLGVVPSMPELVPCANRTSVPGSKGTDEETISASVGRNAPVI